MTADVEPGNIFNDPDLSFHGIEHGRTLGVDALETRIHELEKQIDSIEDQSRRNNLKFFGVDDSGAWESWEQSEQHVRDIMKTKLDIPDADAIAITRAHRLSGTPKDGKKKDYARPIIVKFDNFKDRQRVLMASGKLKRLKEFITEDFCTRTNLFRHEVLKPRMQAARDNGKYAVMRHRRLIIKDKRLTNTNNDETAEPNNITEQNIAHDKTEDWQAAVMHVQYLLLYLELYYKLSYYITIIFFTISLQVFSGNPIKYHQTKIHKYAPYVEFNTIGIKIPLNHYNILHYYKYYYTKTTKFQYSKKEYG